MKRGFLSMFAGKKIISILVIFFITTCVGIASAQRLDQSLEEKTSMPAYEVEQNPNEAAKTIINNYLTGVMNKKNDGTPLIAFEIVKVNSMDLNELKVSVVLKYENYLASLPRDYSIIPVKDHYQVQKQFCVYDFIPDSPTYGTLKGCTPAAEDHQTSITLHTQN
jgi:hypothetical protein